MARTEIRVTGFGGQGIILSGYIIGKAAALYEGKNSTLNQSFGPEARGSACSAQVIISDEEIHYPYIRTPRILIAMSQEAFTKYKSEVGKDGIMLIDGDLVKPGNLRRKIKLYSIPATRIAEELGRKIVLNIVMLGFFTSITGLIDKEAMRKAVLNSVPKGTEELNLKAFEKGYEYGVKYKKEAKKSKRVKLKN
ncbi:MAG: 2-oxoacid:acceptor oxidoreductase family protein [Fidelibacterota bacterium]